MRRSNPGATNKISLVAPGLLRYARNDANFLSNIPIVKEALSNERNYSAFFYGATHRGNTPSGVGRGVPGVSALSS
jgi:hypothetical protein